MLIIGLGHEARQGKDTLAAWLKGFYEREANLAVARRAHADELKKEVATAVAHRLGFEGPWPSPWMINGKKLQDAMEQLCEWAVVPYDAKPDMTDPLCPYGKQRALLQWWGTEYRRASDQDYWVKKLYSTLEKDTADVIFITDCRFPNELRAVKEHNGITVNVNRLGHSNPSALSAHASERSLKPSDYDYRIYAENLNQLYLGGLEVIHPHVMRRTAKVYARL